MSIDLTNSALNRQNTLNTPYALQETVKATHIACIPYKGKAVVLKEHMNDEP